LAVLEAAADLMLEGGLAAATMEAIAARASVSKVTIYKWWPTRGSVAVDAYFHRFKETMDFGDSGELAGDLASQMQSVIEAFRGRGGEIMAELIGQSQTDQVVAETLRSRWIQPRREAATFVVQRSIDRGEIDPGTDIPALLDLLYAPLYYRLLIGHEPLDSDLAATLIETVLDGVRRR
jgi:AcrR family transcriptional regulator